MTEIIAALIIACSNLTNGGASQYPDSIKEFAKAKSDCVQRVSTCVAPVMYNFQPEKDILNKCSKEVRL